MMRSGAAITAKKDSGHFRTRYLFWRRHPESDRGIADLQSAALPLGYGAIYAICSKNLEQIVFSGAAYEARTRYLHLGKVALYQMS